MPEVSDSLREAYVLTAINLRGSERRVFMAQIVTILGEGGQRYAEREFGWNRNTIRKGMLELKSGQPIADRFHDRGRKPIDEKLPSLLADMRRLMASGPITTKQMAQQLIAQCGYALDTLPSLETLRKKMRQLEQKSG